MFVAVALAMVVLMPSARAEVLLPTTPGVYISQINGFGDPPPMATIVPAVIGHAVVNGPYGFAVIESVSDLGTATSYASETVTAAVTDFFVNGGEQLAIVGAASADAHSLVDALELLPNVWGAFDLFVPELRGLTDTEWMTVADDVAVKANALGGMAWLDPPADSVGHAVSSMAADPGGVASLAERLADALGDDARSAVLLSAGVASGSEPARAASPGVVGLRMATDEWVGPWQDISFEPGLAGVATEDQPGNAALIVLDEGHVTPIYDDPLGSTVPLRPVTLNVDPARIFVTDERMILWVKRSARAAMLPYVFQPNNMMTWSALTAQLTSQLTQLWQEGAFFGSSAGQAFSATCGASGQEILNGYAACTVTIRLTGYRTVVLSLLQMQATAG